jgi:hypothetical protein
LSGAATEYGQDCYNGVDMAVQEINAAGGVTVKGGKYTFKLAKLDDRADPTLAKNNAIRFVSQNKAIAVFNPVATTIGALMAIPEQNFIIAAFSSGHTIMDKGHPMINQSRSQLCRLRQKLFHCSPGQRLAQLQEIIRDWQADSNVAPVPRHGLTIPERPTG